MTHNINHISYETLAKTRRPDAKSMTVVIGGQLPRPWSDDTDGQMRENIYNELLIPSEFKQYLTIANTVRHIFGSSVTHMFGMHPHIDGVSVHKFNFAVFKSYEYIFNPTLETIVKLADIVKTLYAKANMIHTNICPILLGTLASSGAPIVRPCGNMLNVASVMAQKEKLNVAISLIPSPVQVIIDMLSSTLEKEVIDYTDFKLKFVKYWDHLLPAGLKQQIPRWVCAAFSASAGCVNYLDHVVNRYCVIEQDVTDGRTVVRKTPSKAMGYLHDIDVFALCVSVFMMQRPVTDMPSPQILQYLGDLLKGDQEYASSPPPSPPPQTTAQEDTAHAPALSSPSEDDSKIMYKGQVRVVRTDEKGSYILWQKQKMYFPLP